jgi:hypothetical protein
MSDEKRLTPEREARLRRIMRTNVEKALFAELDAVRAERDDLERRLATLRFNHGETCARLREYEAAEEESNGGRIMKRVPEPSSLSTLRSLFLHKRAYLGCAPHATWDHWQHVITAGIGKAAGCMAWLGYESWRSALLDVAVDILRAVEDADEVTAGRREAGHMSLREMAGELPLEDASCKVAGGTLHEPAADERLEGES